MTGPLESTSSLGLGSIGSLVDAQALRTPQGDGEHAAQELEALFATLLVKEMRKGMSGEFFGEGSTGDIYGGWFDEHVGRALSESGALDLVGMIKVGAPQQDAAQAAAAAAQRERTRDGHP